jgi:alpha-L-rhamnosidase
VVRNIKISNVHGKGSSLGEITGHNQATISDILVENVDVDLKTTDFQLSNVQNLRFKNVKVNGKTMPAPEAKPSMAKK